MNDEIKKAIEKYQCSGCVCGSSIDDGCFVEENGTQCSKHCPGTTIIPIIGRIFLGMPKGFCRMGFQNDLKINIFESFESLKKTWEYDKYNIPCWKHFNKSEHTIVRGLSPRINSPFLHVILEDCRNQINCVEITEEDLEGMD